MAVLRSREMVPTETTPRSQRTRNGDKLEPCTPAQTKELSPSSHKVLTGSGSVSVSVSGVAPRRSLRLASKAPEPSEGSPLVPVEAGGRWRRAVKSGSHEAAACSAEEKANREDLEEFGRVLDGPIEELKLESGGSCEPGLCSDSGEAKGKRKMEDGGEEIGVLSLRSGKRVAKRGSDGVEREKQVLELGIFGEDKGKGILVSEEKSAELDAAVAEKTPEIRKGKRKMSSSSEEELIAGENGDKRERRGGHGQLVEEDGPVSSAGSENSEDNAASNEGQVRGGENEPGRNEFMGRFRDIARRNASRFAHFDAEEGVDELPSEVDDEPEIEDWPGPFSTALKIITDRERRNSQAGSSCLGKTKPVDVDWFPKKSENRERPKKDVPSLQELSLQCLANNADKLVSLDNVPDYLRHRLSQLLCDNRRMDAHFLELLVQGSPTEVRLKDCSWLKEDEFTKSLQNFDPSNLVVLQLGFCGRCLPDYLLCTTLSPSANSLPALTTLSVRGACRLSDIGLSSLVSSAPALRSLDLTECSLLSFSSIDILANSLGSSLRELYLDHCLGIDVMLALPALKKLEQLEVLSLVGLENVCDDFIREFISIRGHNMKELILAGCVNLTDSSVKIIAEKCPCLCTIDLSNLCKLTDSSLGYLANGCRAIQTLRLCRNTFSDNGVAAFVETSGECLEELSLNNVRKVGCHTALSIAKRSRLLRSLDISFCRNLTDNAVGLIVDSCLSLRVLKLFACTQITDVFLNGHSNPGVKIIGLPKRPVLEHLEPSI